MIAAPPETFAVTLATAADPATLRAWLAGAAPGDRAQYAAGIDLPRETPGVVLVAAWIAAGLVDPVRSRDPHDARRWQFSVIKRNGGASPPVGAAASAPASPSRRPGRTTSAGGATASGCLSAVIADARSAGAQTEALFALLVGRAVSGRECPTFAETVDLLELPRGQRGRKRAEYLFKRLADQHRIAVSWGGPGQRRVVTIRAKGRAQGLSTSGVAQ